MSKNRKKKKIVLLSIGQKRITQFKDSVCHIQEQLREQAKHKQHPNEKCKYSNWQKDEGESQRLF